MKKISVILLILFLAIIQFITSIVAQDDIRQMSGEFVKDRLGKGWIRDIEFSPDGKHFAVATTIGIWIYDTHTGRLVNQIEGFMGGVYAISYSYDGEFLAAAHDDHTIRLWKPKEKEQVNKNPILRGHDNQIYAITFSHDPSGSMLASASQDNTIRLWNPHATDKKEMQIAKLPYNAPVRTVEFSSDNKMLAGGSDDGIIQVWDSGTGDVIHKFVGHTASVQELQFSPDRVKLVSVSLDRTAILWSLVGEGGQIHPPIQHDSNVYTVKFSPDGNTFATGSEDKLIRIWDTITVNNINSLEGHKDVVTDIDYSPDNSSLISGSSDGVVYLWDITGKRTRHKIPGHIGGIKALVYNTDNRIRACGKGLDGKLRIWDAGTGSELSILRDHIQLTQAAAFSKDGEKIASGGNINGKILISNVSRVLQKNAKINEEHSPQTFDGNPHGITALAFSPANSILATGGEDGRIHLMDIQTHRELKVLRGAQHTITSLTFVRDSTHLFSGEKDGTVRYWNALTGVQEGEDVIGALTEVTALAFSPALPILAIGDGSGTIRLYDYSKNKDIEYLNLHTRKITSLVFADDNQTLVSGSEDGTILLWDLSKLMARDEGQENNQGRAIIPQETPTLHDNSRHEKTAQEIARKSLESTVHLMVHNVNGDTVGYGTGFFIDVDKLATNFHVIDGSTSVYARQIGKETWHPIDTIYATDIKNDLAILKLSDKVIPILPLANSDNVQPGETVYVVGNPRRFEGTLSKGIVSAVRTDGKTKSIQIDASISPGSSGGPVLNSKGEVIGVATSGLSNDIGQNLNFAVPSNYLKELLKKVKQPVTK